MSKAVLDAGPLIHLSELHALGVLIDFEVLYIPPVVWDEVVHHQSDVFNQTVLPFERVETPFVDPKLATFAKMFSLDPAKCSPWL